MTGAVDGDVPDPRDEDADEWLPPSGPVAWEGRVQAHEGPVRFDGRSQDGLAVRDVANPAAYVASSEYIELARIH